MTSWLGDSFLQLVHRQIAQEMEGLAWICECESLLDLDSLNSSKSILSFSVVGRTILVPLLHHTAYLLGMQLTLSLCEWHPWGYATRKCKLPPCPTLLRPALLHWLEGNSSQVLCYSPDLLVGIHALTQKCHFLWPFGDLWLPSQSLLLSYFSWFFPSYLEKIHKLLFLHLK